MPLSRPRPFWRPLSANPTGASQMLWAIGSASVGLSLAWVASKFLPFDLTYPLLLIGAFASCYAAGARAGIVTTLLCLVGHLLFIHFGEIMPSDWNDTAMFVLASSAMIALTAVVGQRERIAIAAQRSAEATRSTAVVTAQELDLLIDSATEYAICLLDPQGRLVIWNIGAERLFGWREDEIVSHFHDLLYTDDERLAGHAADEMAISQKEGRFAGRRWQARRDGSSFLADVVLTRIDGPKGELIGYGKVIRDVTQDEADAAAIEAREMHLHSILATVPDAMIVIDEHGVIQSFSSAAQTLFGYQEAEVVGRNVAMLMPSSQRDALDIYLGRNRSVGDRRVIGDARRVFGRRKDGSTFAHELSVGEAIGGGRRVFTGFIRDLTERESSDARLQDLQSDLLHISRVSAVGTMAATLAHELNQPLTALTNYVQSAAAILVDADTGPNALVRQALGEAGTEALRAGAIVRRLREFIARGELDRTIEPVGNLIADAKALGLADARLNGIRVTTEIGDETWAALVDRVQIQQVLVNLIRNAIEAIPASVDGLIRIIVERQGETLLFSIADNGQGLTPEIGGTIFDAFVSTKARGMGLGLSICRTIIEAHGGRIWCESPATGGTAFHFTLPAIGPEPNDV